MFFARNCLLAPMLSWFIPLFLTTTSSVRYTVSSCYRYARAEQICQDKYCLVTDFIYPASQDLRFFSIIIYTLRGTIFLSNWCRNVCDLPLRSLFQSTWNFLCIWVTFSYFFLVMKIFYSLDISNSAKRGCFPFPRLILPSGSRAQLLQHQSPSSNLLIAICHSA